MSAGECARRISFGYMELDDQIAPEDVPTEGAVEAWLRALRAGGIEIHPEETFAELINMSNGKFTFRSADAERLDRLMERAYEVCDPCAVALRIVMQSESAPARPSEAGLQPEVRVTEQGDRINSEMLRDFLKRVLASDAVADEVSNLLFEHVVAGRLHPSVVAETLPSYIHEILNAATREDWQAVADELIAEAREIDSEV